MSEGTANRIVLATVADLVQELREDKAVRRLLQMLTEGPPPIVVDLLETLVGTLEERDVVLHP